MSKMDHEIKICDDKQGAKKILPSNITLDQAWLNSFVLCFKKESLQNKLSKESPKSVIEFSLSSAKMALKLNICLSKHSPYPSVLDF